MYKKNSPTPLYHPSEQFQTSLHEVSDKKEKVTLAKVTVPKFTDNNNFEKAVRLAKCYGLYNLAKKYTRLMRGFLFSNNYLSNHLRDMLTWREAQKLLQSLDIIDKPELLKKEKLSEKLFSPKYRYSTSLQEFIRVYQKDREHFCKAHSLTTFFRRVGHKVLKVASLVVYTYVLIAVLVLFSRNNIPLPFGMDKGLKDMSAIQIIELWQSAIMLGIAIFVPFKIFRWVWREKQ
ncbi:hypothetical protein CHH95_20275 [Bacillus licheniformis]|uniref:hypothetical protein n=1 Tax=Bacillus licheniformis TaxID=1402 RepID=UPI000BA5D07C|nr:hypothetical protein [Bacillus licheniformis]PAE47588.1 hypothetical protein CHH95_20275 [Bacillus licheniformis]